MGSYLWDTLRYAARRRMEQWHYGLRDRGIRDWSNDNPAIVIACAAVSVMVFFAALTWSRKSNSDDPFETGRRAWFYDQNTQQLFEASSKKAGPIKAPSGPLPDGSPAGVRAHVYSHIPEPNESDLFIGFLEMPAPQAAKRSQIDAEADTADSWARNRMIKRPEDETWVPASGHRGREILSSLTRPNAEGQTPMYHRVP